MKNVLAQVKIRPRKQKTVSYFIDSEIAGRDNGAKFEFGHFRINDFTVHTHHYVGLFGYLIGIDLVALI